MLTRRENIVGDSEAATAGNSVKVLRVRPRGPEVGSAEVAGGRESSSAK
jgi:hypothetical protein